MVKCNYCGKELRKPLKIGPKINYCNWDCYDKNFMVKYPDTGIANHIAIFHPDLAKEVGFKVRTVEQKMNDEYAQIKLF